MAILFLCVSNSGSYQMMKINGTLSDYFVDGQAFVAAGKVWACW